MIARVLPDSDAECQVRVLGSGAMEELDAEADLHHTPCGDGTMVWRRWGNGQPIVLLHGGSGSWTHWVKTIPELRKFYEVWAIDIPGLGDSAMPAEPFTPQSCANAVASGFKQFFTASKPATMVCFSFGCHVGTLAAVELNDRLSGMIIIGSASLGLGRRQSFSLPKARSSMTESERRGVHYEVLANLMFTNKSNIDEQAVALQAINVAKARFRSRGFADSSDVRDGLARVTVPIKSIWGSDDIVAHPSVDACLDALRLHHPELEHHIIEDAGHWVMYEAADAFNAALLKFLPG